MRVANSLDDSESKLQDVSPISNNYHIRIVVIDSKDPLITNLEVAIMYIESLLRYQENMDQLEMKSWQDYLK